MSLICAADSGDTMFIIVHLRSQKLYEVIYGDREVVGETLLSLDAH